LDEENQVVDFVPFAYFVTFVICRWCQMQALWPQHLSQL